MNVQIEHPETGERFEVSREDYDSRPLYVSRKTGKLITYRSAGFHIVANADGTEYHPAPKPAETPPGPPKPAAPAQPAAKPAKPKEG